MQLQQVLINLMTNSADAMKDMEGRRELTLQSQCGEDGQNFGRRYRCGSTGCMKLPILALPLSLIPTATQGRVKLNERL